MANHVCFRQTQQGSKRLTVSSKFFAFAPRQMTGANATSRWDMFGGTHTMILQMCLFEARYSFLGWLGKLKGQTFGHFAIALF